jgi:hypothetical protein
MPGWTDLKAEIADCWKTSWNVDPLELRVPVRAELLDDEPLLLDGELLPDEPQADSDKPIARSATPAAVTPWMRTRSISDTPLLSYPPSIATRLASIV